MELEVSLEPLVKMELEELEVSLVLLVKME